jgi:hypothetical protein
MSSDGSKKLKYVTDSGRADAARIFAVVLTSMPFKTGIRVPRGDRGEAFARKDSSQQWFGSANAWPLQRSLRRNGALI